jgi:hypothetical protein
LVSELIWCSYREGHIKEEETALLVSLFVQPSIHAFLEHSVAVDLREELRDWRFKCVPWGARPPILKLLYTREEKSSKLI